MTKKKASARRGLRLLWHRLDRPSRGPKPTLTLGDIIESAIAVADRDGLTALSMRSVAERLGFTTMSLYRYVPGKGELVEVMRDVALGEPPTAEPALDWREQLRRWARANL